MDKQVAKINSAGALASLNLRADSGKGAEEIKSEDVSTTNSENLTSTITGV
jgi:hypothetical protein